MSPPPLDHGSLRHAFVQATIMNVVAELGDKTFIISAIMAAKYPRMQIFLASLGALATMTVLGVSVGVVAPQLISPKITHWIAVCLFFVFGVLQIRESLASTESQEDEVKEIEDEIKEEEKKKKGDKSSSKSSSSDKQKDNKSTSSNKKKSLLSTFLAIFPPAFLQCYSMTFFGEWGDRSQMATVILAATEHPIGVCLGSITGQMLSTIVAVLGGKLIATRISEKTMGLLGGTLFIIFAIMGVLESVEHSSN